MMNVVEFFQTKLAQIIVSSNMNQVPDKKEATLVVEGGE